MKWQFVSPKLPGNNEVDPTTQQQMRIRALIAGPCVNILGEAFSFNMAHMFKLNLFLEKEQ